MVKYSKHDLVRFWDIIPGAIPLLFRLPAIYNSIRIRNAPKYCKHSLGFVLEKNARRYPDKIAILYEDTKITHKEFNDTINRYAHFFMSVGIKIKDTVIVYIENRPELLFAVGALSKIGAISYLINTNHRERALVHSIKLTSSRYIIVGEEMIDAFEAIDNQIEKKGDELYIYIPDKNYKVIPKKYINLCRVIQDRSTENPTLSYSVQINDTISYIYTSGTTGLPKATPIINRRWLGAAHLFGGILLNLKIKDTIYCPLPLFHTTAFGVAWASAAVMGSSLAIRRKFSVSDFWSDVKKFNATSFAYVGEICRYLLNQPYHPDESKNRIKKIFGNGLGSDIWMAFKDRFGIKQIYEFYGAAEFDSCAANLFNLDNTVGIYFTPFAIVKYDQVKNVPIRGRDGFLQRVKKGDVGLLLAKITKKVPFHGYTDKAATKSKVIADVFKKADMWFDTGDLVRDLGFKHLQFVDRLGDTFRWKGENVSTTDVEEVLNSMPQVLQAVVYGVQIPNSDGRAGMAAIIPTVSTDDFDSDALLMQLNNALPQYAVPKFIRLCKQFNTTSTFKIKKSVLQNEGFNPDIRGGPVFALLPGKNQYVLITADLYDKINSGRLRY